MRSLILRVINEQCLSFPAILFYHLCFSPSLNFPVSYYSKRVFFVYLFFVVVFLVWLTSPSDCSFHSSACYWAWLVCRYDLSLALLLHVFLYLLSLIISEHSSLGMSLRVCITTIQGFLLLESPQRCQMISSISTCMLHSLFPFKFLYSSFVVYI